MKGYPGVHREKSRHGRTTYVYRPSKDKPRIRLPDSLGSQEFIEAYEAAKRGETLQPPKSAPDSLRWLVASYVGSAPFKALKPRTQHVRRLILEGICQSPGGNGPWRTLDVKTVQGMRDRRQDRPEAANSIVKALRALYTYAQDHLAHPINPAAQVPYISSKTDGFHCWTRKEVEQFRDRHPLGTKARLALELLYGTGQRRGDVIRMGRQHVEDDGIWVTQEKTGARLWLPISLELQDALDAGPTGDMTFLVAIPPGKKPERPYTAAGFGNWFRRQCDMADLGHCSAHGLRKARLTHDAEDECTEEELRAISGHTSTKHLGVYTKRADQKRLARNATAKRQKSRTVREGVRENTENDNKNNALKA